MTKVPARDGMLLMFSIPVKPVYSRQKLVDVVNKRNLDQSLIPRATSEPDKFAKACSEVIQRPQWRNVTDANGRKVVLRWTKVQNTKDVMQQDLMQQVIHGRQDFAGHFENPVEHSVFKMFFHKNLTEDNITFHMPYDSKGNDKSDKVWAPGVDYYDFIQQVVDQMSVYADSMDSKQMNEAIRRYLGRLNARQYRKIRSAYYIPDNKFDQAEEFIDAIREISDGQVDISGVPLYPDTKVKQELAKYFEESLIEDIEMIVSQIDEKGEMQDRKIERLQAEIDSAKEVMDSYTGKMPKTKVKLELQKAQTGLDLAKDRNKAWKESKEAEKIKRKEQNKTAAKPAPKKRGAAKGILSS